jgi:immune inhibitor A
MSKKRYWRIAMVMCAISLLLIALVPAATNVAAAQPKIPAGLIAVDMDPYYKGLDQQAASAKIMSDTVEAAATLDAAKASWSGSADGVVGDVEWLYADYWQEFTLKAIGDNCEIWLANDLSYPAGDPRPTPVVTDAQIEYMFEEFNSNMYPSDTEHYGFTNDRYGTGGLFASMGYDWYETDNPQRVMILIYNIIDEGYYDPTYPFYVAGYFWPQMNTDYADRNIIHIDCYDWADRVGPDVTRPHLYEGTFTHEYEHAIHYDHDPDEASWVDEGMADLSGFFAGYGHPADHLAYYLVYHRTSLTDWGNALEDYGESYLFQLYLNENFGGADFIKALVDEQANGIEGINNQLAAFGYAATFDDVYRDWTLANYLDDVTLTGDSGAKLGYESLDIPSDDTWGYSIQWSIKNNYGSDNHGNLPIPRYWGGYKSGTVQYPIGTMSPYAPMYLTYKGMQPELISNFRGDGSSGVEPYSGDYELFGGRASLLFNSCTLASPLTLGADAELSFWTWYDIEEFWDFGFVQISTDGGSTWASLANDDTTSEYDPSAIDTVIDNVPGFTGSSGGWVQETFDLSAYAGESVLVRFLYITDWATELTGFFVDDIAITDGTGTLLTDGLESGSGNWVLEGWQRTTGLVANDWQLSFINPQYDTGKLTGLEIQDSSVYPEGNYQYDLTTLSTLALGSDVVTIVVSNHQPEAQSFAAGYRLLVSKGTAKK